MTGHQSTGRFSLRHPALAVAVFALTGLLAVACSGSGIGGYGAAPATQAPAVAPATPVPPPAATSAPVAQAAPTAAAASSGSGSVQEVQATLTEFGITLSTSTLKAGHVRFNVMNTGKFTHALEIMGQGVDQKTANFGGGQSATLEVDLAPGQYEVWCPVGNHKERGMDTTITVQ